MRAVLVKVYLKSYNVFLSVSSDTPIINVFRPIFDFLATTQMTIVRTFLQIDILISERHFKRPVMIAAKDKFRTTVRLDFAVRLERLPTQNGQSFL